MERAGGHAVNDLTFTGHQPSVCKHRITLPLQCKTVSSLVEIELRIHVLALGAKIPTQERHSRDKQQRGQGESEKPHYGFWIKIHS